MIRLFILLFALLVMSSTSASAEATKERIVVDRIVAVVDERAITRSSLDQETLPLRTLILTNHALDDAARDAAMRDLDRAALRQMIDTYLLVREATRRGSATSDEEIDRALEQVAREQGRGASEFTKMITQQGYDEAQVRRRIGEQIVSGRLASNEARRLYPVVSKPPGPEQQALILNTLVSRLRDDAYIEERL